MNYQMLNVQRALAQLSEINMQPHEERVVVEQNELFEKVTKLNEFMLTDLFKTLSDKDKGLLAAQFGYMCSYLAVLQMRTKKYE